MDRLIQKIDELGFELIVQFRSKKNAVYLVERHGTFFVLKVFSPENPHGMEKERQILVKAFEKGIPVPRVIDTWDNYGILLEYIDGTNLCDSITIQQDPEVTALLGRWLADFHRAFKVGNGQTLVKGDTILRNFILGSHQGSTRVFGVDFEDAYLGDPLHDVGMACASILDTEPAFTPEKVVCCNSLIESYSNTYVMLEPNKVKDAIAYSLRNTAKRRPYSRQLLIHKAKMIQTYGLSGAV